jgi:hypothetical protein
MSILHWIYNWILGWGGIGAVVSIILWAAWYFSPIAKPQLLHGAIIATVITATSTYVYTKGYNDGRTDVRTAVQTQNRGAFDAVKRAESTVDQCYDDGNTWDRVNGRCSQ